MRTRRPLSLTLLLLLVGLCAILGPLAGTASGKKAKKVDITATPNLTIPDATGGVFGYAESTIEVGKKSKGLKIRDVNVTVQTTGSTAVEAAGLIAVLIAPDGGTNVLFFQLATQNLGPLTLDDESRLNLASGPPPAQANRYALFAPYVGSGAQPGTFFIGQPLAQLDNGPVRGTWTLRHRRPGRGRQHHQRPQQLAASRSRPASLI